MPASFVRRLALAACTALLALPLAAGGAARSAPRETVVVASKIDTEGTLLGNMILLALAAAGVPVESRLQLGPTKIVRTALLAGEIDLYPEYTGNGAFFFDQENDPAWKQAASGYETVRRLDREANRLVWLDPAPADNAWIIAVRGDLARREHLVTMEDFAALVRRGGKVRLVASAEFVESPAALPAFEKAYGFRLARESIVVLPGGDTSVTASAAARGVSGVNAAMAYGTDGALAALDLVALKDPKGAQIVYEPAPVVRAEVLARHPAIGPALSKVFATLTAQRLRQLNARIAVEGRPAREVARAYLEQAGFVP